MSELLDETGVALPTVGRIVHVTDEFGDGPWAAIVTETSALVVAVTVFYPGRAPAQLSGLSYSATRVSGDATWCWPERT